jgi:hypothetical protein
MGLTSHPHLKIPIAVDENSFCSIKKGSLEAELIQQTSLLIYDKITMLSGDTGGSADASEYPRERLE